MKGDVGQAQGFLVNRKQLVYSAPMKNFILVVSCLLLGLALLGCGAAEESAAPEFARDMAAAPVAPGQPQAAMMGQMVEREVAVEQEMAMLKEMAMPTAAPMAAEAPAAMATAMADSVEVAETIPQAAEDFLPPFDEVQASVAAQERIIVRTVRMGVVVDSVPAAVDRIGELADGLGGWTVFSDRSAVHWGNVSVRVPAQELDEAVRQIRALAIRVDAESSSSQDVTDEYVDTSSRLRSLRATEESLLNLLGQATKVEDALDVQRELADLQSEIESLEGRIKFLQQTAAFSLINVDLTLAPQTMPVDAGPDQTFSAGQVARFRATFRPPEEIDEFRFTWDFGDGTTVEGSGSAPTTEPGQRVTATVNHVFGDDRDSPYIVQLEMTGTGEAGLVEGSDTLIATVTRIASIEVFAGESRVVEEGEEVEYSGSFTRPEGLRDIQYRWDFGDGSPTIIGTPEEGATRATALHTYENYRYQAYEVTLTVTAQSEAGEVKGVGTFYVDVVESQGLVVGNWDLMETARVGIRGLSVVALVVVRLVIWLVIFSPVWLALGAAGYGLFRLNRYRRARKERNRSSAGAETEAGQEPAGDQKE